ncbi:MAG: hypothetical protein HZA50_07290 [Planctomycetes bacterium]|nr:hypothetical protein [Planctomycetota bacterium]
MSKEMHEIQIIFARAEWLARQSHSRMALHDGAYFNRQPQKCGILCVKKVFLQAPLFVIEQRMQASFFYARVRKGRVFVLKIRKKA